MVNMEIMHAGPKLHAHGSFARILCLRIQSGCPDTDLPGLQSHARYSVFKDRRHVERFPRCEKRTGNLALSLREVKRLLRSDRLFLEGLFLQHGQYRCGRPDCQGPRETILKSIAE